MGYFAAGGKWTMDTNQESQSEARGRGALTDAQRHELEKRLREHAANPDDVVPWKVVKAEALARFRKMGQKTS